MSVQEQGFAWGLYGVLSRVSANFRWQVAIHMELVSHGRGMQHQATFFKHLHESFHKGCSNLKSSHTSWRNL